MASGKQLIDKFGRMHDKLRISVTDTCDIRCYYCMPQAGRAFTPRAGLLSVEEIERIVRVGVNLGLRKIRLTGGEPLVRKDLNILITRLMRIEGIESIALTTNGVLLADRAQELYDAGLRRINVHLDSMDREMYRVITRRDAFDAVMNGLRAASDLGYGPIKINAVAVKGRSECDIVALAQFGRKSGMQVRFIEFMPLDSQGLWNINNVLSADEMGAILERAIGPLIPITSAQRGAPATEFRFADGIGTLGFIASVTKPFCGDCNRVRLTADGKLRYCLFAVEETDLRPLLLSENNDAIESAMLDCVQAKWQGHTIGAPQFVPPPRPMSSIGG
jgi:cyclic pyranopterin phosphate synthase